MSEEFDAIILGTGQAGPPLAGRLNDAGMKVAILERDAVGGTCVNRGCIPTKTLVASARAAHMARRGADFGVVSSGEVRVDMAAVKARMKRISGESNQGLTKWLEGMDHVELIRGEARMVGPREVAVGERRLRAPRVFLNVGGRPRRPKLEGADTLPMLDSSSMLEVDFLPRHLIVVGGSYIGLEFGQMYRRFGSEVSIVQRGERLIPRDDPDVSEAVREFLEGEGIEVRLNAECLRFSSHEDGIAAQLSCDAGSNEVVGSHVLLAVGRVPNTDGLGLDAAGVEVDERGFIVVDDQLRTSAEGVWAMGDCNGQGAFTHTSYNDYEIVAANLLDDDPRRLSDRIPCYGLFTDPPLGRVGMTEAEARASGRRVLVGKRPMTSVGRAKERSETAGFLKILVDGDSEQILGASLLGIGGDEVVHTLLALMAAKASYKVLARTMAIHPTVAELLPTTLQSLEPLD